MIPFNRPSIEGRELDYVVEAIQSGKISGDGVFTQRCHELLQTSLGVPHVLLTTSCTTALEMAGLLLEFKPGDEFILPSFTYVSTANAFVLHGGTPVFADVRPDTLNVDEDRLGALVTNRTVAIVLTHYAGVACEMDAILELSRQHGLAVIEDNALGLFATYKGRHLGSFGALAAQSFHETKNFGCGEGGALLINDPAYVERALILRDKGTDRSRFFRGEVDKYTWVDLGSSYLPSDLLAAVLYAQLEQRESIQSKRRRIWETYAASLSGWAAENGFSLPVVPAHCAQSYHMFYMLGPNEEVRDSLIEHLKQREIQSVFHYQPLHLSAMGLRYGGANAECAVAERVAKQVIRLPFYNSLAADQQAQVIETVLSFAV